MLLQKVLDVRIVQNAILFSGDRTRTFLRHVPCACSSDCEDSARRHGFGPRRVRGYVNSHDAVRQSPGPMTEPKQTGRGDAVSSSAADVPVPQQRCDETTPHTSNSRTQFHFVVVCLQRINQ